MGGAQNGTSRQLARARAIAGNTFVHVVVDTCVGDRVAAVRTHMDLHLGGGVDWCGGGLQRGRATAVLS